VENYLRTVTNDVYVRVLGYTVILTLQATVVALVLGYLLAYSMIRMSRYTTVLLLLIILPFWTNYIVRMYAWMNILQRGGLLDWILTNVNVLSEPSGFLYTHGAVLVGLTYVWLPLATLPFYASLSNMDEQLIDAAKDLGAGPITTFFKVTLPMTKDGLVAGIVLVAIPAFGTFVTPDLLGGTDHVTLGMVIDQQFNQTYNWPFGAALGVLLSSFVVLLVILAGRLGTSVLGRSDV
jgi:spermidine/putrescine transport system permease protein